MLGKQILRDLANINGRSQGYGGCQKCEDCWSWKAGFHITYWECPNGSGNAKGAFPVCEECVKDMSNYELLKQLLVHFIKGNASLIESGLDPRPVEEISENLTFAKHWLDRARPGR